MTDRDAFLRHIIAEPDDDAPRLVFADWLDEHGDPDRAEFIRVQCERARLPAWDVRQVALAEREQVLDDALLGELVRELPDGSLRPDGWLWGARRRGFFAEVQFRTFTALREHLPACAAATPLEAVTVRWPRRRDDAANVPACPGLRELTLAGTVVEQREVARLAGSPLLSTVRTLNAPSCSMTIRGFRRLVRSPHLGSLRTLRVPMNSIGNRAFEVLANAGLNALEELDISEVGSYGRYGEDPVVTVEGVDDLAVWPGLARLHTLAINGNAVGRDGLLTLFGSRHLGALRSLSVRSNGLTEEDCDAFGAAPPGLRLDVLDISDNLLRRHGVAALAGAACLSELKSLNVERCEIGTDGAAALAKAPFLAMLRVLKADSNSFGTIGLRELLDAAPPHLHTLSLMFNDLTIGSVESLAQSPAGDRLAVLDVSGNRFGDDAARLLAEATGLRGLRTLRMHGHPIGKETAALLRESPLGRRLADLSFDDVPDPPEGDDIPF